MSKFKSAENSFLHINSKFGVTKLLNHAFIRILEKYVDKTEDHFTIKKQIAEALITMPAMQERIMCSEIDTEDDGQACFCQVMHSDLYLNKFPEDWINFIIIKK